MATLDGIQRAAVQAFAEKGYAATGIRDIAAKAGVTSGTLYLHASNKMAILESVMQLALDELLRLAGEATSEDLAPAVRLEGLVRAHVSVQALNPLTAQVVDGEVRILPADQRSAVLRKRDAYEAFWTATLEEGLQIGDFIVDDVPIARLAMLEMCNGVAHWYRPDGPRSLEQIQDIFVRLVHNLVRYGGEVHGPNSALGSRILGCEPQDGSNPHAARRAQTSTSPSTSAIGTNAPTGTAQARSI